jgi:hypothetical protein
MLVLMLLIVMEFAALHLINTGLQAGDRRNISAREPFQRLSALPESC